MSYLGNLGSMATRFLSALFGGDRRGESTSSAVGRKAADGRRLYIVKSAKAGSYQGIGAALSGTTTLAAVTSGNQATVTGGTTPLNNQAIRGSGVPTGAAIAFVQAGVNWYLCRLGATSNPGWTWGPATVTRYDATNSWDSAVIATESHHGEGALWNGLANSITNGSRGRIAAALAAVPSPRIVAHIHNTGANDKSSAATTADYQSALERFIARIRADFDMTNCALTVGRVNGANADSLTVRAAQAAVAASADFHLVDTDSYPRAADNLHWNLAGLESLGSSAFDNVEW